jgi:hypothetical protein
MASETPKGRPADFSIDAAILKVLINDPSASVHEIAQEAKLPASTLLYILTTHMGYIYRRFRLAPHNLSEPHKIDPLWQGHELFEILQNVKRSAGGSS